VQHINGVTRSQVTLFPESVEDYIDPENPVRFLDVFVDELDIESLGFTHSLVKETGRPPYHPKDLLKLYLYGYLNRIRSSRLLERETKRNLEVIWLLKRLSPDHKTISNFRKDNKRALKGVFKEFVLLCKGLALFSAELIAIDSTKFKASNSRSRVKDKSQLNKVVVGIEESIKQYIAQLDAEDSESTSSDSGIGSINKEDLQEKINRLKEEKKQYKSSLDEMNSSGDKYISLTDSDCRLMKNEGVVKPSYNVHAAVDSKHSLIVDYEISQNAADNNYLPDLAKSAKENLDVSELTVCADAGYYDTTDIKECEDQSINTYVPIPEPKISKKTQVPQPAYYHDCFIYDEISDTYQCPQGQTMRYFSTTKKSDHRRIRLYRTPVCKECVGRSDCTTSPRGRYINRWEHEEVLDRLKQRMKENPSIMKLRKQIIEHIFGTLKKIWGYHSFLLRGLEDISSEITLMCLTYNIRRVINIMGTQRLITYLHAK
jgi:transposase